MKTEKKLTAVEWLVEQFETTINYTLEEWQLKIEQAKAMEKEQMKELINEQDGLSPINL